MTAAEKLTALRGQMKNAGADAYIIASADAHQSEYTAPYWQARAWLSGFTGSSGLLAVTEDEAGLWTDGRYFIQAEEQLAGSGIRLFKMYEEGVPDYPAWLRERLPDGSTVGFDGHAFSVSAYDKLQETLRGITLAADKDLVGVIWKDRPAIPAEPVFEHALCFAGGGRPEKLSAVRAEMTKLKTEAYLIASLDAVAWLLNIRGRDIPYTPVAYAYALITGNAAHLFIAPDKLNAELAERVIRDGYTLHAYGDALPFAAALETETLLYDPDRVSIRLAEAVPAGTRIIRGDDIVAGLKAVKSETELENIRRAHIKEGVVMTRLLKQLDEWASDSQRQPLRETDISRLLAELRQHQDDYLEPSFETIAAYGENAASMHYSPQPGRDKMIEPRGFLLIDTGAQYLDGTTDITRTLAVGRVTEEMQRDYTLVLKGHIALAMARFPSGTTGAQLDAVARTPLWAAGMNYRSGTGHGLGYCLSVHEGPHNISHRPNKTVLKPGMLCTNEPGVYKEGRYGIRTENVLLVKEVFTGEDGVFLGFETLSLCPIGTRALDISLITAAETKWLNSYHERVYETLSPHLTDGERGWLRNATRQIGIFENKYIKSPISRR